jgi:hypothetical protein
MINQQFNGRKLKNNNYLMIKHKKFWILSNHVYRFVTNYPLVSSWAIYCSKLVIFAYTINTLVFSAHIPIIFIQLRIYYYFENRFHILFLSETIHSKAIFLLCVYNILFHYLTEIPFLSFSLHQNIIIHFIIYVKSSTFCSSYVNI